MRDYLLDNIEISTPQWVVVTGRGVHSMDDSERYRKEQDLIFQELEEKAALQKQALEVERALEFHSRMKIAQVGWDVIEEMFDAGKKRAEIMEFLDGKILEGLAKNYMALRAAEGKPIRLERAVSLMRRVMTSEE